MSPSETYRLHDWFHIYLSKTTPIIQTSSSSSSSLSSTYLMKSREDTAARVNKDGINNYDNHINNDNYNDNNNNDYNNY